MREHRSLLAACTTRILIDTLIPGAVVTSPAAGSIGRLNTGGLRTITALDPSMLKFRMFDRPDLRQRSDETMRLYRNEVTGKCVTNQDGNLVHARNVRGNLTQA